MLHAYTVEDGCLRLRGHDDEAVLAAAWIDLVAPTREEETLVESALGIEVPTREEMREIEPSSRLYVERGARFMTASVVTQAESHEPILAAITFILHGDKLVTVRYEDPKPFGLFVTRAAKSAGLESRTGEAVLGGLVDTIVDRLADILEHVSDEIDRLSTQIFRPGSDDHARSYQEELRALGRKGALVSKVRESLVSLSRLLLYLTFEVEGLKPPQSLAGFIRVQQRDTDSLALQVDYIANKIQFLLDAVLGMVSIEQNNIVKIFAVLSVILMPPTLVASIYGMNFKIMPELEWRYGYPYALVLMVAAGVLPYLIFKWKRWL